MTNDAKKLADELARGPRKREALVIWCMRQGIEKKRLDELLGELAGAGRLKVEGASMAPTYRLTGAAEEAPVEEEEESFDDEADKDDEHATAESEAEDDEDELSGAQVAELLGVRPARVAQLAKAGRIPARKATGLPGRPRYVFKRADVNEYLAGRAQTVPPAESEPKVEQDVEEEPNFLEDEDRLAEEPEADPELDDIIEEEALEEPEDEPVETPEETTEHAPTLLAAARRLLTMEAHPVGGDSERVRALKGAAAAVSVCTCGLRRDPETKDCLARCRAIRAELRAGRAARRARKDVEAKERKMPSIGEMRQAAEGLIEKYQWRKEIFPRTRKRRGAR